MPVRKSSRAPLELRKAAFASPPASSGLVGGLRDDGELVGRLTVMMGAGGAFLNDVVHAFGAGRHQDVVHVQENHVS